MKTVFALLIFFLAVGLFARSDNRWTRVILGVGILIAILYLSIS